MKKLLVYDFPTRFFHWVMAGAFVSAYFIAQVFDDESPIYPYHMMIGLTLASAVLLRIVWGIFGSKYSRFSEFALKPTELFSYMKDALSSKTKIFAGHNPASSWVAILMMLMALGLAFTGFQMALKNNKEFFEEVHELLANGFMILAVTHVVGIIFHTVRHRDPIGLSMLSGKKTTPAATSAISSSHPLTAVIFLLIVGFVATSLFRSYDPQKRSFSVFGTILEFESHEHGTKSAQGEHEEHDHDGDQD